MAERFDFATPQPPPAEVPPSTAWVVPRRLVLDLDAEYILCTFVGDTGQTWNCRESGATAVAQIKALNKANLSTKSLSRRLIEYFRDNGQLPAGTISGLPD